MTFYEKYLSLCRNIGKSPSAVANAIGLNNSSVTYWKRGSLPKAGTVVKLADYFGVPADYLIDEDMDDPYPFKNESLIDRINRLPYLKINNAYKVNKVEIDENGKVTVVYELAPKGISADEFQKLLSFVTRLSDSYGIAVSEILDIMHVTTKTVTKVARIIQLEETVPNQKGDGEAGPETDGSPATERKEEG